MKQIARLTTILMLLLVGAGFAACSDDDDDDKNSGSSSGSSIVGTWRWEGGNMYEQYTFNKNNTGFLQGWEDGYYSEQFTYTYENDILTITTSYEDGDKFTESHRAHISGNKLTMDGLTYTRVS